MDKVQSRRTQIFLSIALLLGYPTLISANVWCDEWRDYSYSNFAQLVSIGSGGYHFCGGMTVDRNWVISSYSCIQNMMMWRKNTARLQKSMEQQTDGCVEMYTDIEINSVATDNCKSYNNVDAESFASSVQYGIRYPQFEEMGIPNLFEPNISIPVFTNDLILLKLHSPFNWINDFPIDISVDPIEEKLQYQIELLTWQLHKPNGLGEQPIPSLLFPGSKYGLQCEKMLRVFQRSDVLEEEEKEFVQRFGESLYCLQYSVPVINNDRCRTYHAGDPVIIQENEKVRLLGLLTEGFVHPNIRDGLQPNDDENRHYCYSQEDVGDPAKVPEQQGLLMFLSFQQEQVEWINKTIKSDTQCEVFQIAITESQTAESYTQVEDKERGKNKKVNAGLIVGVVLAVVSVVAIGIYALYRFKRDKVREIIYVRGIMRHVSLGRARRYSSFRDSTEDTDTSKEMQIKSFPSRDSNEGESNGNEIQLRPVASRDMDDQTLNNI